MLFRQLAGEILICNTASLSGRADSMKRKRVMIFMTMGTQKILTALSRAEKAKPRASRYVTR